MQNEIQRIPQKKGSRVSFATFGKGVQLISESPLAACLSLTAPNDAVL